MKLTTASGWECDYDVVPDSGLVLSDVFHGPYLLARDIRVVGVWGSAADPNDPANSSALRTMWALGGATCPQTGKIEEIQPPKSPAPPADFNFYKIPDGLSVSYEAVPVGFGDKLTITQEYQFGTYGLDPPHEPGGVLQAARLLPLVTFRCEAIPVTSSVGRIEYIRIDYRMNYTLEVMYDSHSQQKQARGSPNQAGIFRDNESPASYRSINEMFVAAEKPLQYEIVGRGLGHGKPVDTLPLATWDNIHQWPKRPYGDFPLYALT